MNVLKEGAKPAFSSRDWLFYIANPLFPRVEIKRTITVVDHLSRFDFIHRGTDRRRAETFAAKRIEEQVRDERLVVFDNDSQGEVIAIEPVTRHGRRIKVTRIFRYGKREEEETVINSPTFHPSFFDGERAVELLLSIHGTPHGKKKEGIEEVFQMSSDGPFSPRGFTMIVGGQAVFGRVDKTGYFTCSLEYDGGIRWVMREKTGTYTALEFRKAEIKE